MKTLSALVLSLSLLSACERAETQPAVVEPTVEQTGSALTANTTANREALNRLGVGWTLIAPGLAEKRTHSGTMHAALNEQGNEALRARLRDSLAVAEAAFAKEPTAEREAQVRQLREAVAQPTPTLPKSAPGEGTTAGIGLSTNFTGYGTCTGGGPTGTFRVTSTSDWSAPFPVLGEAAAVSGGWDSWYGYTASSGSSSTTRESSGPCGTPITGWHGHRVSGTDPATGSAVKAEGALWLMSCTPDCAPPPPPPSICGPGYVLCSDYCGEERCYRGTSCPARTPKPWICP